MKFEKNLTFKQTIDFNEEQLQKNEFHIDSILESGFYYKHLSTFMNEFPADQIKIIIFEDYIKTPQKIIQSIFSFLGLKEFPNLIDPPKNSYRVPTNEGSKLLMNNSTFRKLSKRLIPTSTRQKFGDKFLVKESKRPPVPHEERNRLKKIYNDDVDSLKKLLDIKLPWNDFN